MAQTLRVPSLLFSGTTPLPRYVDSRTLGVSTNETWTVPADVNFVLLSADGGFFVRVGTGNTADDTPGDLSDGTASLYIPSSAQFEVDEGVVLNFISTAARVITIGCFSR